jgi:ribose transport system substrate-binding protein
VLAISACSSSSDGSGGSASGSGGGSTSAEGVAAAKTAVADWLKAPTTIPLTEPLKSKPPTAKTFVWMKCDVNQCVDMGAGMKAATEALGWNYMELNFQNGNPATLVTAMNKALQYHPVAVGVSGLPREVWQSVIPAYKAAGVAIVTGFVGPTKYDDTVIGQVGAVSDFGLYGKMLGSWIVADSKGSGHILLQTVSGFAILKSFSDELNAVISKDCPACKITTLDNTIPQISEGRVVPTIVSALQRDRSIKYVAAGNGPFVEALPAALAAAGLDDVKITAAAGDVKNLTDIQTGKLAAATGLALQYSGWLMLDIVLRHLEGTSFDPDGDGGLPAQLLTNDQDFAISNSYDQPADYADQFKKLWQLR